MTDAGKALRVLGFDAFAFTACFALWMLNGVLVTHLVEARTFAFDPVEIGFLIGLPVLTGSIFRLPVGLLADRYGGRRVFVAVLLLSALGAVLLSRAHTFAGFLVGSLGFGFAGTSFAVGIAHTADWFPPEKKGTALGIFGAGNAGSALTAVFGPSLLDHFTRGGANPDGWRLLPLWLAALLVLIAGAFVLFVPADRALQRRNATLGAQLQVLRSIRVWRFGLYYFLVFGCFVALAQWLVPYYVSVFGVSLATAGLLTAVFSFPSGVIRALGGYLSDRYGARRVMYAVFGCCVIGCLCLSFPDMKIVTTGESVVARLRGEVTQVSPHEIVVGDTRYPLRVAPESTDGAVFLGVRATQQPVVRVGDRVARKQLLARGTTEIVFSLGVELFTALAFVVGIAMGIGKAAVYKFIPDYFPDQVGAVGGLVGVIGGLGGFVCPILFGVLLHQTGVWSSAWFFLFVLSVVCFGWMHAVVRRLERSRIRGIEARIEAGGEPQFSPSSPERGAYAP